MIRFTCDGCGKILHKGELRYTVKIDVRAAYDKLEIGLLDLIQDHEAEIAKIIDDLADKDPSQVEEAIYKNFELDLCPACQKAFIREPLRFHPENAIHSEFDVDEMLRSLGYGESEEGEPEEG